MSDLTDQLHKRTGPRLHHWKVQRQVVSHPDGNHRWDQLYQHLLSWTLPTPTSPTVVVASHQEVQNELESSPLCQGFDRPPSAGPDY